FRGFTPAIGVGIVSIVILAVALIALYSKHLVGSCEAAGDGGFSQSRTRRYPYLSCVEMSLNLPLRVEPIVFTVAMITTEMPAAIRPYSIAVAPDSSFRNAKTLDI